ncbi:MAG: hypothetical protein CMN03_06800 [Roseibacillus sp.]|nr:hypothetical protein [Roseibacillus sp.]
MPEPDKNNQWNRLVDAAREAGATTENGEGPEDHAPSTFVSGVITMRQGLWKFARTVLWRRWSLIVALMAIALYLVFYTTMNSNSRDQKAAPEPSRTLPLPPDSAQ